MFFAINQIFVRPGTGSQLEERFGNANGMRAVPGFLEFILTRKVWFGHGGDGPQVNEAGEAYDTYLSITRWRSREDFDAWTRSDHFRQAHSRPKLDIFVKAPGGGGTGYDVIADTWVSAEAQARIQATGTAPETAGGAA